MDTTPHYRKRIARDRHGDPVGRGLDPSFVNAITRTVLCYHHLTRTRLAVDDDPDFLFSSPQYAVASAVEKASTLVSKVMYPIPGQWGTTWIDQVGVGEHTTVMWQRETLVYAVFANSGVSSATWLVDLFYPKKAVILGS